MTGTSLAAAMLIALAVMIIMSYWRQIAILILYIVLITFCLGIYFVVCTIKGLI
jgi:uncharacterized membrane protein